MIFIENGITKKICCTIHRVFKKNWYLRLIKIHIILLSDNLTSCHPIDLKF